MRTVRRIVAGHTVPGVAKRCAWARAFGIRLAPDTFAVDRHKWGLACDSTGHAIAGGCPVFGGWARLTRASTRLGAKRVHAHAITGVIFGIALTEFFWIAKTVFPALNVGFTIDALPGVFVANKPGNAPVFDAVFNELVGCVDHVVHVRFALIRLRHIVVQNGDWETVVGIVVGASKQAEGQKCEYEFHSEIQC